MRTKTIVLLAMLITMLCCPSYGTGEEIDIQFKSGDIELRGKLFLPETGEALPGVVVLHGGSSSARAHRATSTYYARKLAEKGITVLTYDKRGTGDSGGAVATSTFDDYVKDAIHAVSFLKQHPRVNAHQVGIFGPSQGGRIGALAAARNSEVAFVVSIAGPLVSIADLCYFSSMEFIQRMGISDSTKTVVDPLWRKHYRCVEERDAQGLKSLDKEIDALYTSIDTVFLPVKSDQLDDLGDFQPMYNSMANDYITELSRVQVPWLCIYSEFDSAVPVEACTKILRKQMGIAGNEDYRLQIIPNVDHMLRDVESKEYFPVENIVIDWILNEMSRSGE
jgi:pimeloyl-ACP methyl ester carboxylesterase